MADPSKTFRTALGQKSMVITATLPLAPESTAASIKYGLDPLLAVVDAVQLQDNREARGHMSPLAAASIVKSFGADAMVHVTCRDRNRIALQADLLGAAGIGVTTVLLSRGEKLKDSKTLRGKGVFDIRSAALTKMARLIGDNREIIADPGFLIGAPVTVFEPADDWMASRILNRIEAGARFFQSQPCLNAPLLEKYLRALVERKILHRGSFIVEVPLFSSPLQMREYTTVNPSALIPESAVKRMLQAKNERSEGIALCAEMLRAAATIAGVSGVSIDHNTQSEDVVAAIAQSGLSR